MTLTQIGEQGLLRRIRVWARSQPSYRNVSVGIGDDAAVVNLSPNLRLLASTDTLAEDTHFRLARMRKFLEEREVWRALGYKAMAASLSDLAAMGAAKPLFALVTLGARGDISVDTVDNVYRGISKLTRIFHFPVVGGDIIRSYKSLLSVTIVGELITHKPVLRSGAQKNNIVMATGPLGLSAAGLKILEKGSKSLNRADKLLLQAHLYPQPRLREGKILGSVDKMSTALLDLSDDLMTSLEILSREGGVGLEINLDQIPVHPALQEFCGKRGLSPYRFILWGGEDYELLFTAPAGNVPAIKKKIPRSFVLGRVRPKPFGIQIFRSGKRYFDQDARFRHFQ